MCRVGTARLASGAATGATEDHDTIIKMALRRDGLKVGEDGEVVGIGRKQSSNAAGVKHGRKMRVQDALAAKIEFPHPVERLAQAGVRWLNQADGRVGKEVAQPLHCLAHGKRRGKPAFVRDDVQEFCGDQRRENQFFPALRFRLNGCKRFCVGRMVGDGELDKDVAIQANHCRENMSSAISD